MYGIPGNEWRGFKVADDARGPVFDPTVGERLPSPEALRSARDYLAFRFPALKEAPLLEARVCQYENSPDRSEEHTSELQSQSNLVCRLLLEKKKRRPRLRTLPNH